MNLEQIYNLKNQALALISDAKNPQHLKDIQIAFLGRKGKINELFKEFAKLPKQEKIKLSQSLNEVKNLIKEELYNKQFNKLSKSSSKFPNQQLVASSFFDPTLPGKKPANGHLHPVSQAIEAISQIFENIGFVRVRYPEVEWDWYAFESLNMPKNHPARDEWETFFIEAPDNKKFGKIILTPHTSSGQVREMQRIGQPPIRMINIAKCYRRQSDITHTAMFHQFEGLVVDKNISIAHLKGVTDYFVENFYGQERKTRLRPFHFQFTEPSFEVDINCGLCLGKGCKTCKSGWLELGGAGMVHPNVLKAGGIDPKIYSGFAFGWGVERTYMMKSGIKIDDNRLIYSTDIRFLDQF